MRTRREQLASMSDEEIQEAFREAIREVYEGKERVARKLLAASASYSRFEHFFDMMEEYLAQRGQVEPDGTHSKYLTWLFEQFYAQVATAHVSFYRNSDGTPSPYVFQLKKEEGGIYGHGIAMT